MLEAGKAREKSSRFHKLFLGWDGQAIDRVARREARARSMPMRSIY